MKGRTDKWTDAEEKSVVYQVDVLQREPFQVRVRGRTQRSIDHKISDLRSRGLIKTVFSDPPWTDLEDGSLLIQIAMLLRNLSQIKLPGRTEQGIYARIKKLRKMGFIISLVRRLRPQQVQARKRRKKVEKRKITHESKLIQLRELIEGVGKYWPSVVVARVLHCKPDWVGRWRKRWDLTLVHDDAIVDRIYLQHFVANVKYRTGEFTLSDMESVLKKTISSARTTIRLYNIKVAEEKRKKEELERAVAQKTVVQETKPLPKLSFDQKLRIGKLEQKFRIFSSQGTPLQLQRCASCSHCWYLHAEFFPIISSNGSRCFGSVCVACL